MTIHKLLRKWALDSSGYHGLLAQARTNWCPEFIALMRARMVAGFFRYRRSIRDVGGRRYDNVGSALARLETYLRDGNKEHLVDVANLCMCEYRTESCHSSPHWATIDDGEHTEEICDA
jgi:hypothetical protein